MKVELASVFQSLLQIQNKLIFKINIKAALLLSLGFFNLSMSTCFNPKIWEQKNSVTKITGGTGAFGYGAQVATISTIVARLLSASSAADRKDDGRLGAVAVCVQTDPRFWDKVEYPYRLTQHKQTMG